MGFKDSLIPFASTVEETTSERLYARCFSPVLGALTFREFHDVNSLLPSGISQRRLGRSVKRVEGDDDLQDGILGSVLNQG